MIDLDKYNKSLFRKIITRSDSLSKEPDEKELHKYRIDVKKLRALAHLIAFYQTQLDADFFDRMQKAFGKSGNLRDIHVVRKFATSYRFQSNAAEKKFNTILQLEAEKALRKFLKNIHHANNHEVPKLQKEMKEAIIQNHGRDFRSYYDTTAASINLKIHNKQLSEQDYHPLRMEIKELKYNLALLNVADKNELINLPNPEQLRKIEKTLGSWHDTIMLGATFSRMLQDNDLTNELRREIEAMQSITLKQSEDWQQKIPRFLSHSKVIQEN